MTRCIGVYKIFAIAIVIIVVYWMVLLSTGNVVEHDFMNRIVFDFPQFENCCSMWPLSHFFLFMLIGYLFPDCDVVAIAGGILWEIVEVMAYKVFKNKGRQAVNRGARIEYSKDWWMGSFKDIFFNIAGFYVGKLLS